MFNVFVIALREGVEVAVILAIIFSYLKQLGQLKEGKKVWLGTGAAVLISVLIAVGIFIVFGNIEIEGFQAALEGSLKILAVIMLTWMTIWMKHQSSDLSGTLKEQIKLALGSGSVWTLALLAFISVIREGIETVLFIVSTAKETGAAATIGGAIIGLGLAAVLGLILYRGTHHLPLKAFFTSMSVLLIVIGAGLLSGGIHEFQEMHLIPEVVESVWNTHFFIDEQSTLGGLLKAVFGYRESPNLVMVAAYCLYLIATFYAYFRKPTKQGVS